MRKFAAIADLRLSSTVPFRKMAQSSIPFPPEILEKIFACLIVRSCMHIFNGLEVLKPSSRSDLLACALSSRNFFDPAIRILWYSVELMPLLKLLPDFKMKNGTYVCTGKLNDKSLERFDFYSRNVGQLFLRKQDGVSSSDALTSVSNSAYNCVALARPRPLPNLTHFYCSAETFHSKAMVFMVSSSLKSASFYHSIGSEVIKYLSQVDAKPLQSLTISCRNGGNSYLPSISQHKNLRSLDLALFHCPAAISLDLLPLYCLEHLESLRLDLRNTKLKSSSMQYLSDSLPSPKALKQLRLLVDHQNVVAASTLLKLYEHSPLEVLHFGVFLEEKQCKAVFSAIPSLWATTLTTLFINLGGGLIVPRTHTPDSLSSFIAPLYRLRALKEFSIRINGMIGDPFHLTDTDILKISEVWPNLTELMLGGIEPQSGCLGRAPTVASLPILARNCPNLEVLNLPFDVRHVPRINKAKPRIPYSPGSGHKLKHLTLNVLEDDFDICNLADRPAMFAYHLDMVFPFLEEVVLARLNYYDVEEEPWDAVNGILELCLWHHSSDKIPIVYYRNCEVDRASEHEVFTTIQVYNEYF
ncbi:hypothetical protein D9758_014884 [Tetrapyrgos nigripes]|uniref:Ig-like domain-containing protein n=1 Tax=Tetrapyrgos nigripes TaxID=182062 RepID=A0A8H5CDW1_9AGAR|nr:hypothetical protein D9758_014884 [Tetrapyrgos nigripes]